MTAPPKQPRSVYAARLSEFSEIALACADARNRRGRWREFFAERIGSHFDHRVIFEIGCADGEFLARIAAKFPGTAFVGLDWKCKAIYDAASRVTSAGLTNVAFIRGRAQEILRYFAPRELDEIWIFHPEPCDREVELKNRLINQTFLIDAHAALRDRGSSICLKTDHAEYYEWTRATIERSRAQFDVASDSRDFWNDSAVQRATARRCFANEATTYENRFRKRRAPIHFVELARRES